MHLVLVNRLGGLRLPRNNVISITDYPDKTIVVYGDLKAIKQQQQQPSAIIREEDMLICHTE